VATTPASKGSAALLDRLRIFFADGLRHRQLTGYGALARNLALGLVERGHDVHLRANERPWGAIEQGARERLEALPHDDGRGRELADLVLQVRSPPNCSPYTKPTLIYTQNALGGLPPEWIAALSAADGIVVPSAFDRAVFAAHFPRVYVAGQSADAKIFKPVARLQSGEPETFCFLYVGSYSFRKGVDLLLRAFLEEFSAAEPVALRLQCPGAGRGEEFNHCLDTIQRLNPQGRVRLSAGERSPEWMNRLYNASDCVITCSRGEGWCMPLTEALLCEVPVIAPRSTGMAEYLDDSIAELVSTTELPAACASSPFAGTFATVYDHPGISYYEPSVAETRSSMRRVYEDRSTARAKARAGRRRILRDFSWDSAVDSLEQACLSLLADTAATA
jgi:glycosyltransferase involved in cell wall biosynthesis